MQGTTPPGQAVTLHDRCDFTGTALLDDPESCSCRAYPLILLCVTGREICGEVVPLHRSDSIGVVEVVIGHIFPCRLFLMAPR